MFLHRQSSLFFRCMINLSKGNSPVLCTLFTRSYIFYYVQFSRLSFSTSTISVASFTPPHPPSYPLSFAADETFCVFSSLFVLAGFVSMLLPSFARTSSISSTVVFFSVFSISVSRLSLLITFSFWISFSYCLFLFYGMNLLKWLQHITISFHISVWNLKLSILGVLRSDHCLSGTRNTCIRGNRRERSERATDQPMRRCKGVPFRVEDSGNQILRKWF